LTIVALTTGIWAQLLEDKKDRIHQP